MKLSTSCLLVHYHTGVESDYLPHETFFARAKRVRKVECGKNYAPVSYSFFIPREPNNHIKVMILRIEWYKILKTTNMGSAKIFCCSF